MTIAIITGGGSGIGAAVGRALALRGDTVILADIDSEAADDVAAQIVSTGGRAESAAVDVRDGAAMQALADRVVADHGRIDIMFNNAGIGVGGPIEDLTLEHWQRIVDINIMGVVHGIRAVYPQMIKQGDGHILNTASLAGLAPSPMLAPYGMTKHAVVGLSLSLRPEAAAHGIRVTALCPGPTETPILDSTGPADLAPTAPGVSARDLLLRATGEIYPVEKLAADVVAGLEHNRALIVAPRRALLAWWLHKLVPSILEGQAHKLVAWSKREAARVGAKVSG